MSLGNNPQTYKELFNLRHVSAQNTIGRSFGILKKPWSILRTLSYFLYKDTNNDYQYLYCVTQLHHI